MDHRAGALHSRLFAGRRKAGDRIWHSGLKRCASGIDELQDQFMLAIDLPPMRSAGAFSAEGNAEMQLIEKGRV